MWPAGNPGNVGIVIFLVHDWIFVKYPGPGPGITILSIFDIFCIFDIFGFRCARPPAGPRVLCQSPLICDKMLKSDGIHNSISDYSANVLHSHMELTHVARRKSGKCRNCEFLGPWLDFRKVPGPRATNYHFKHFWHFWHFRIPLRPAAGRPPGTLPKSIDLSQNIEKWWNPQLHIGLQRKCIAFP